ncbi:MAG: NUDIX domain-containing protein [Patescibacteria group bacterium]|nr:NUDIX domain-containing protein [Patescibacteria group bacterium]MBU1952821.1 NUDIX domain-containing protein [Patescibacteria group bacterium]
MKRLYVEGIPQVVVVFVTLIRKGGFYLFTKRSPNASHAPSLWGLPGGHLEMGEDISKTLEREVKEETNLVIKPEKLNFYLEKHKSELKNHKGLMYINLFYKSRLVKGKLKLNKEHTDFKWLPLKQALKLNLTPEVKRSLLSLTRPKR